MTKLMIYLKLQKNHFWIAFILEGYNLIVI